MSGKRFSTIALRHRAPMGYTAPNPVSTLLRVPLKHPRHRDRHNGWQSLEPLPLLDPDGRYCLLFSNKAGCTTLVKWFFTQTGELEAALAWHRWIHRYRTEVYCRGDSYREGLSRLDAPDLLRVKVVRSPYSRAVSSYLHAIRTAYCDHDLSRFLGRAVNPVSRFTFAEFIAFLASRDLGRCDPHYRRQATAAEIDGTLQIGRQIRLESLASGIRALEADLGLRPVGVEDVSRSPHHQQRSQGGVFCGERMFHQGDTLFPPYTDFYREDLANSVRRMYAEDFSRYGYNESLK